MARWKARSRTTRPGPEALNAGRGEPS
jgi:hypothetical protein